jgi:hypothetical protein
MLLPFTVARAPRPGSLEIGGLRHWQVSSLGGGHDGSRERMFRVGLNGSNLGKQITLVATSCGHDSR